MSTSSSQPSAPTPDQVAEHPSAAPDQPAVGDGAAPSERQPGEEDGTPAVRAVDVAHPSRVRRAPRYGRFAFLGLVLGALLSLILALVGVSDYSTRDVFLVLFIGLGTAGVFAGLVVALLSDRRSVRRRG